VKLRQLGIWAVTLALSLPAWSVEKPGEISGYVRDAAGSPQMGAAVEIAMSTSRSLTVFTDAAGFYSAKDLIPGYYSLKVSAPEFLPALREKIGLHPGGSLRVNVTLSTLWDAMRVAPRHSGSDDDDWKWTLRSAANRPVLRVFDDPSSPEQENHDTTGSVSFVAGSAATGYGSGSDMSTTFSVERSIFSADRVGLSGNVGYGDGLPTTVLRGAYSHRAPDGSGPSMAVTMRRFAPSDPNLHYAALQALAINTGDTFAVGNVLELQVGSQLQAIQFLGHVTAFRPYGSVDFHASPNTVVEYAYTTSLPQTQDEKGFDSSPADLSEADPRLSISNFTTRVENARHQEVSISRRIGQSSVQFAAFRDRIDNTALLGTGTVTAAGGYLLPDMYSGTFSYTGNSLDTDGFRVVLGHRFCSDLTATLDYAFGGALDLAQPDVAIQNVQQWISTQRRHAMAAKLSGKIPHSHTRLIASYRWVNGSALTPVDMFNASPGQADPYLNLFIRQPIPTLGFLPGHMDAVVDIRNLLAQGYVQVVGQDGQTVYLVQSARSLRGGVTISF
jgi:hypothetical protein